MRARRIAIVVDHPQRDLAGALLNAFELCQRGHCCYVVPLNVEEDELMALAPDFVLLNYLRMANYQTALKLHDARIPFGMLDTEGGVWESCESYTELLWQNRTMLRRAGPVCMWGPILAAHVVSQDLFASGQVSVTGCSRFDFYHPSWRAVLDTAPRDARRRFRVLVNTNFSVVNPRFTTPEKNAQYCHAEYGWSWECIEKVTTTETRAIGGTIQLVHRLAADRPDLDIVVRPHPFESLNPYLQALGTVVNVTVNGDGPVQPQICRADAVIQRSCTTAIEAAVAGVPTLSPQWIPAPYLMPMAEAVSVPCGSYEDLYGHLDRLQQGESIVGPELRGRIGEVVADWFHRVDGEAHRRVCDAIDHWLPRERSVEVGICTRRLYGLNSGSASLRSRLAGLARYHLRLSPDFSFHDLRPNPWLVWTGTDKHVDPADVTALIRRIEQAAQARGRAMRPVSVMTARERGDYLRGYYGLSVALQCT